MKAYTRITTLQRGPDGNKLVKGMECVLCYKTDREYICMLSNWPGWQAHKALIWL